MFLEMCHSSIEVLSPYLFPLNTCKPCDCFCEESVTSGLEEVTQLSTLGVPLGGTRRVGGLLGVAGRLSGLTFSAEELMLLNCGVGEDS